MVEAKSMEEITQNKKIGVKNEDQGQDPWIKQTLKHKELWAREGHLEKWKVRRIAEKV